MALVLDTACSLAGDIDCHQTRKMEGVVGKRKDSVYETGRRSDKWRKVINWTYADVFITGYRKEEFGWLAAVPALDNAKIRPAGIIELGANLLGTLSIQECVIFFLNFTSSYEL